MCMKPIDISLKNNDLGIFAPYQRFISVPCGKCDECRSSNAKEWAIKCVCEYLSRPVDEQNRTWFITLTYDNDHVKGSLYEPDMQKFIKRLRKKYKFYKLKYFYCGEYGTRTLRPHYHMIIYNLPINDLVLFRKGNSLDDNLYLSDTLAKVWGNGNVAIGTLSLKSAAYTARYCLKKNTSDCYMRCSKGFGKQYFLDHMKDIISLGYLAVPSDNKVIRGRIPKYYLKVYKSLVSEREYIKFLRHKIAIAKKYQEKIDNYFNVPNLLSSIQRDHLGVLSASVKKNLTNKRIIDQSLMDYYHMRDNF